MEELKSRTEPKSDDSCAEFYDLTDETPLTSNKNTNNRKDSESETYQFEGQRRLRKEKSSYREYESKGKGTNDQSHKLVSYSRSWSKYDERTESYSRYPPFSDIFLEGVASEASCSKDLYNENLGCDRQNFGKSSSELNGTSNRDYRRERRRETPDRYRRRYYEGCASRSPSKRGRNSPSRYYNRRAERSKSRSQSRSTRGSTDSYSHGRGNKDTERSRRRDKATMRSKHRSRSRRRRSSSKRYRRSCSSEKCDKPTKRSKRRSRSRRRSDSTSTNRSSYSSEKCAKPTKWSKRRSRSRRRRDSTSTNRRSCSCSSEKCYKPTKRSERRSQSRSRRDLTSAYRRSYSHDGSKQDIRQSKSQSQLRAWKERSYKGLNIGGKTVSNKQSDAHYSVINILRSRLQSTIAQSSNYHKNTKSNFIDSSCRSHLYQNEWDFDVGTVSKSPPNRKAETESLNRKTSDRIADLVATKNKTPSDSNLPAVRDKIKFTFAKPMMVNKLKVSDAVGDAATKKLTDVKSTLSTLIKSALNVRKNEKNDKPLERNIESYFRQRNEPETFVNPKEQSMRLNIPIKENLINDNAIDNDIIKKIISRSAKDSSTNQLAANFQFDIDSVKRALTTVKKNENKNISPIDVQRYAGTALIKKNPNDFQLQEIPALKAHPQQEYLRLQPYCPVPIPRPALSNLSMIRVAQGMPTPIQNQFCLPPIYTPTPVSRPIPSVIPFRTPALPVQTPALPHQNVTALPHQNKTPARPLQTPPLPHENKTPARSLQTPPLPHQNRTSALSHQNIAPLKPSRFNTPLNKNVDRPKNQIINRRSTVYSTSRPTVPIIYSKTLKETKALDWNFKIPKKTATQAKNKSPATETINKPSNLKRTEETMDIIKDYGCEIFANHPTENENVSHPVENPFIREENALTTLQDLMGTNQLASLVDLMKKMTQNNTLMKVKEVLMNCVTNEEAGEGLSTSSSTANNIRATNELSKNITNQTQNTQTTRIRARSLSPTSACKISINQALTKQTKVLVHRMKDVSFPVTKPTFKNIELQWHSLKKILSCQICDKPHGNSLVSHYVNYHPNSEVLVSRLSPEVAELVRSANSINKCEIMRKAEDPFYQYKQLCFFCNVYKCLQRNMWFNHMAKHTGYYRYKCIDCARKFAEKPLKHTCVRRNNFEPIPQAAFQVTKNDLQAYVCDICNYVRFDKKEIEKHLSNEHEDDTKKFKKVTFLTFPEKGAELRLKFKKYRTKANRALDALLAEADLESAYLDESCADKISLESECESDVEREYENEWERQYALQKNDENEIESDYSDLSEVKEEIIDVNDWETLS